MPLNNRNPSAGDRIAGRLSVQEGGHGGATASEGLNNLNGIARTEIAQPNGPIPLDENSNIPLANIEALVQTDITLTGPSVVVCGLDTLFAITNYDSYFTYSLFPEGGDVSISGQFVVYTAPITPGPCGFYIDGRFIELSAVEGGIQRPTITTPSEGYMANTNSFSIEATPFTVSDNTGSYFEVLKSVDWELSKTSDFNIVFRSNYGANSTAWSVTGLDLDQDYYLRVRYHGIERSSEWSATRHFRATSTPYLTAPTITSPSSGAVNQLLALTVTASAFTPFNYTDTHASTDWQIATDPDFAAIQFQSLLDAGNLTSWPVSGLDYGTIYYIRAKYHGVLDTSGWSMASMFTVKADDRVITAPSIASPLNASTGNLLRPTITSSDFAANFAENHVNTDWQVSTNSSFTNLILNISATTTNKLSFAFTFDLDYATTYYARVKHRGNIKVSEWSNYTQFTVKADDRTVTTPTIDTPANNATNQPVDPIYISSAFTPVNYTDSHVTSDWQVARDAAFSVIYLESQADDTHKTSYQPGIDLLYGTDFYTRVRYHGSTKQSQWSSYKKITTKADDRGIAVGKISHASNALNYAYMVGSTQKEKLKFNFSDPLFVNYTANTPGSFLSTDWGYGYTSSDQLLYTASIVNNNDSVNRTSYTITRSDLGPDRDLNYSDINGWPERRTISGNYKAVNGNSGIFYNKNIYVNSPILDLLPTAVFLNFNLVYPAVGTSGDYPPPSTIGDNLDPLIIEISIDEKQQIPGFQKLTHVSTRWTIYDTLVSDSHNVVYDSGNDTVNKTSLTIPSILNYYRTSQTKHIEVFLIFSDGIGNSYNLSMVTDINPTYISGDMYTESVGCHTLSISSNISNTNIAPLSGNVFTSPAPTYFEVIGGSDYHAGGYTSVFHATDRTTLPLHNHPAIHESSTWTLYDSKNIVIETLVNSTANKTSWTPSVVLSPNKEYYVKVKYKIIDTVNGYEIGTTQAPGQQAYSYLYRFKTAAAVRLFTVTPDNFGKSLWDLDVDGQFVPEQTGVYYTLTSIAVSDFTVKTKLIGASGGGCGVSINSYSGNSAIQDVGGCGAYVKGDLTIHPNDVIVIISATRGKYGLDSGYPGGGKGRISNQPYFNAVAITSGEVKTVDNKFAPGGAGGGYSAIFRNTATFANAVLVAGGGGGANTFLVNRQKLNYTNTLAYTISNIGNGFGGRTIPAGFEGLPGGGGLGGLGDPLHYVPHSAGATYYAASYAITLATSLTSESNVVTTLTNSKFRGQQLQGGHADELYYITADLPTKHLVAASGGGGGGYYGGGAGAIFPWAETEINKNFIYFSYLFADAKGGGNGSSYIAGEVANGSISSVIHSGGYGLSEYNNADMLYVRPYAGLPGEDGFATIY